MNIRDASEADLLAITEIHNAFVLTHTITWADEPETREHRQVWFERQQEAAHSVLVADDGGRVVGYTTYESFRGEGKWRGYRDTAELTIHVSETHWGRGVGRSLIEALVERARSTGIHVLVAAIDGENEASIRFHERLGFNVVARMPETGQKFGRWLDLVLVQRILDMRPRP